MARRKNKKRKKVKKAVPNERKTWDISPISRIKPSKKVYKRKNRKNSKLDI